MLSEIPEDGAGCKADVLGAQLSPLLYLDTPQQVAEGRRIPRKENRQRCLEEETWVRLTSCSPALN